MLIVETIAKIGRGYFVQGKSIKAICRELRVSRKAVRKVLRSEATEFRYEREVQPLPKIGPWSDKLDQLLLVNEAKAARERLTLIRLFEELRRLGYDGGYDAVRRYARRWSKERGASIAAAYVPLILAPGEAYQFDWSHEIVLLSGVTVTVKAAHARLCHSRMLFVRAYAGRFDGFHAVPASVSKTCLVRFDNNKYSVAASAVGRPVEVHAYADRIVIRQDGRIVAEHPPSFGRGHTAYDPWHYVPVLARKLGALRNGAPFKDWVLPAAIERVRRKLAILADGNRQMVDILTAVLYNVVDLVNRLETESRSARQGRLADHLTRIDFIILDELGYLPFAQSGGQLLFHLVSRLYERTSIIVTTNLAFGDWPSVFGDAAPAPVAGDDEHQDASEPIPDVHVITVPWTGPAFAAVKGILHAPSGAPTLTAEACHTLLTAIAKARAWIDELVAGRAVDIADIARREGKVERHIRQLATLAFASPRIVAAIAEGTAPANLTVTALAQALPLSWAEQERKIGLLQ